MKTQDRLKSFVCVVVLVSSILSFYTAYFIVSSTYQRSFVKNTHEISDAISQQVINSMLQFMEKGWTRKELNEFFNSIKDRQARFPYKVEIFRGEAVEKDYGKIEQPGMGSNIVDVFKTGDTITFKRDTLLFNIYPIKAAGRCLSCHVNAKSGDVMGVLRVQQDIGPVIAQVKKKFFTLFLILSPMPFVMAGLIALFVNRRIRSSTVFLRDKITSVNKVRDLTSISLDEEHAGFAEFDEILNEVRSFVSRMRDVAVDREILEFEIKVLEKFIITSEVVRDWKEHVKNILIEINKVMKAYALFSIFQVDEELYDLEIFWRNKPSDITQKKFENIIKQKIKDSIRFGNANEINIIHNIADPCKNLLELEEKDMDLLTKSLFLETPRIGGVVGIGVQSELAHDNIRSLVIDGILTTLLNVIGSIKAIYKYTKDLEFYATRDPLTNLYNQRVFWEMMGYEIGRAQRNVYKFSLLVLDLDNFKNINDSYGHVFGDNFLAEFAVRVRGALRQGDIFARYGGDEFVAVLPEADETQAFVVASRAMESIKDLYLSAPDGTQVKATVSIGAAVYPDHADNAKDLFIFADNMMYKAKSLGRNRISIATHEDILEVFKALSEKTLIVSNAIEEKKLMPYFQPVLNTATGDIECHEVFSRIVTDKGILTAGEFIDLAERLGAAGKLDLILIEKVFEIVQNTGYKGNIFINLSTKSLIIAEFLPRILKLTNKYAIDRSKIIFETTEKDTLKNITLLEKFIDNLKFEGFKFAIDDFGTGFSCFYYVKRFPLDYVKISGEFIRSMLRSSKDLAIVKTMTMLAREFNIKTVAEHVENKDILDAVRALGIDYAQGVYIGSPLPDLAKKSEEQK
ncbi:MAG: bifunctional diguanylate cyclase/phosphodiesterase [Nitrospirae bacterium]|nr:bifunctional diguanylate cyclase/phosphodiesterase [Nitrospirota bacterium]